MSNMVSDNYVRWKKLNKLMLNVQRELITRVFLWKDDADLSESILISDSLKLIKLIKTEKNILDRDNLDDVKTLMQRLDAEKDEISSDKYARYFQEILELFDDLSLFSRDAQFFNPSPDYAANEIRVHSWPECRDDVLKGIFACIHFRQVVETYFGPGWSNDQQRISEYIEEQIDRPEFQHPAVKSIIKAAKTQKEIYNDGMKSVIIICVELLLCIKCLLIRMSPQEIVKGFNLALKKSSKLLEKLICFEKDGYRYIPGAGGTEIELAFKLNSSMKESNANISSEELCVRSFSCALLRIPATLIENAGLHPDVVIDEITKEYERGKHFLGFDVKRGKLFINTVRDQIFDNFKTKSSLIEIATNTACGIIKDFNLEPTLKLKMVDGDDNIK